jgi:thiamine-phosphate pyrophosphorylase
MPKQQPIAQPAAPRLYLVTPEIDDAQSFARELAAALGAADIAAVLLRLKKADERALINRVKILAPVVQKLDTALVLEGLPDIVARGGADGAHLTGLAAFEDAIGSLKPERIAGCGGLQTRHDAMVAGEHGADYVLFGEPDADGHRPTFTAIIERIEWWAEVFEIPCVGYAANREEIAPLVAAGADFVAAGDFLWADPRGAATAISDACLSLRRPEEAA